jgi:hypothetical protein
MFRIQKAAIAVMAASALALTGCGLIGGAAQETSKSVIDALRSDPEKSLRTAVDKADKVESVSLVMSGKMAGEQFDARGVVSFGSKPAAEMTVVDAKDGEMKMLVIGSTFYVQIPAKDRAEMQGKSWMKLDFSAMSKEDVAKTGLGKNAFDDMLRETNPTTALKQMLDAGDFKVVGEEKVEGVKTVRYTAKVPLAAYLAKADAKERVKLEATMKKANIKFVDTDVWVDEKYQLRRANQVAGIAVNMSVTFKDFNKPVTVTPPAAAQTLDVAALMKQLKDIQG